MYLFSYKFILMLKASLLPLVFLTCTLCAVSQARAQWPLEPLPGEPLAEALFDLAERHFPEVFTSPESTVILDGYRTDGWEWSWFYRYYPGSNTYLAFNSYEVSIYVLGPTFGPEVINAGHLYDLLKLFPSGIIRPGSAQCVEIGSPEPGTTAYYRGIEGFEGTENTSVSWQPGRNGGTEVLRHAGSFPDYQHYYMETEHIITDAGLSYLAYSSRTYTGQDPDPESIESVANVESKESLYNAPGLLLGPASRYCLGQSWLSAPVAKTLNYTYFPTSNSGSMPPESMLAETLMSVSYVVSVDTPISVRAGYFHTVVILTNGTLRFIDIETGILVFGTEFIRDTLDNRIESWRWKYRQEQELHALIPGGVR